MRGWGVGLLLRASPYGAARLGGCGGWRWAPPFPMLYTMKNTRRGFLGASAALLATRCGVKAAPGSESTHDESQPAGCGDAAVARDSDRPYWHEAIKTKEDFEALQNPDYTWEDARRDYRQPSWCHYPEAINGDNGCYSLWFQEVTGRGYCKACELSEDWEGPDPKLDRQDPLKTPPA